MIKKYFTAFPLLSIAVTNDGYIENDDLIVAKFNQDKIMKRSKEMDRVISGVTMRMTVCLFVFLIGRLSEGRKRVSH